MKIPISLNRVKKSYFRFTPEGIYCYDGSHTMLIRKDDIWNPEKCKIEVGWKYMLVKCAGEKDHIVYGKQLTLYETEPNHLYPETELSPTNILLMFYLSMIVNEKHYC